MNPRLRLPASPLGRVIGLIPDSDRVDFFFSVVLKVRFFLAGEKKPPHPCIFEGGGEALYSALVAPLVFGYGHLILNLGLMVDYWQGRWNYMCVSSCYWS